MTYRLLQYGFLVFFPMVGSTDAAYAQQTTNLRAGVVKVDVTPPIGMPLAGYADRTQGSTGIRDPLRAAVLVLESGTDRAALITLDLIDVGYEETAAIRSAVAARTEIPDTHILVAASHTHGSPRLDAASDYGRLVTAKIAGAAGAATAQLRPATIGYASDTIEYCINRRRLNEEGVAEMKPNPDGVVDPRVRILRVDHANAKFLDRTATNPDNAAAKTPDHTAADPDHAGAHTLDDATPHPVAVVMHNACHANVFRNENTLVTADFPGVAQTVFEHGYHQYVPSLFLQGAAGDTRPNLPSEDGFRSGTEQDVVTIGTELGATALAASARAGGAEALARRASSYPIRGAVRTIQLPGKEGDPVRTDIQALRLGRHLFLTIPGEPFTAYQLQVEETLRRERPDLNVFLVGYANGSIGYVITEDAYPLGGYEPGVTRLAPEAESILTDALVRLALEVL